MCNIGKNCLKLIKSFEGFRAHPYRDSGGVWTIGYGHTQGVNADTPAISEGQGEALLWGDLTKVRQTISHYITAPLTDNQYAALISLVYNTGAAPLEKTLGTLLNAGNYAAAARQFDRWIYVHGEVNNGLVHRRNTEKALFLTT